VELGKGTGPPHRVDDGRARKDKGKVTRSNRRPSKPEIFKGQSFAVNDGRHACGVVELTGGAFTAIDLNGRVVGKFGTLREASRAFPDGRPQ